MLFIFKVEAFGEHMHGSWWCYNNTEDDSEVYKSRGDNPGRKRLENWDLGRIMPLVEAF